MIEEVAAALSVPRCADGPGGPEPDGPVVHAIRVREGAIRVREGADVCGRGAAAAPGAAGGAPGSVMPRGFFGSGG